MQREKTYSQQQSAFSLQPISTHRQTEFERGNLKSTQLHSHSEINLAHGLEKGFSKTVNDLGHNFSRTVSDLKQDFTKTIGNIGSHLFNPESAKGQYHGKETSGDTTKLVGNLQPHSETKSAFTHSRSIADIAKTTTHSAVSSHTTGKAQGQQPLVGVIDTGFKAGEHGAQMVEAISSINDKAPKWLEQGVGNGQWTESLKEFTKTAQASGKPAVANLSFDLTQKNPDGSISTRSQFTAAEKQVLTDVRKAGVLVVASAGNQGGDMSALGQASRQFDNIITVGAAKGSDKTAYSSYGKGLDILAPGSQAGLSAKGTSLAAAEVTGAASKVLAANSHLTAQQVKQTLQGTATDLKAPGWDAKTGFGLLNTDKAVATASHTSPAFLKSSGTHAPQQVQHSSKDGLWNNSNGAVASERPDGWFTDAKNTVSYNRNNAVQYAEKYAKNPNSEYATFGADCTNFASQVLIAGGAVDRSTAAEKPGFYNPLKLDWFDSSNYNPNKTRLKPDFIGADRLPKRLANDNVASVKAINPGNRQAAEAAMRGFLKPGDLIGYQEDNDAETDHVNVFLGFRDGKAMAANHTPGKIDAVPLEKVQKLIHIRD